MQIGDVIKTYREALGLSQNDVSTRAGISQGTLSRIEANRQKPGALSLGRIAQVLQCRVDDILRPIESDVHHIPAQRQPEKELSRFLMDIQQIEPQLTSEQRAILVKVSRAFALETMAKQGSRKPDELGHARRPR